MEKEEYGYSVIPLECGLGSKWGIIQLFEKTLTLNPNSAEFTKIIALPIWGAFFAPWALKGPELEILMGPNLYNCFSSSLACCFTCFSEAS